MVFEARILDTDPTWMVAALCEVGVKERRAEADHPRILEYWTAIPEGRRPDDLHDEVPWCSVFANWCMRQGGFRGTLRANARSWMSWGHAREVPDRGCVAVFRRGDPAGELGHVAFYLRETDAHIWVLGGNQHNAVSVSAYPRTQLLGYRLPTVADRMTAAERLTP